MVVDWAIARNSWVCWRRRTPFWLWMACVCPGASSPPAPSHPLFLLPALCPRSPCTPRSQSRWTRGRASPPASLRPTAPTPSAAWQTPPHAPPTSSAPATSSRCATALGACWCAQVRVGHGGARLLHNNLLHLCLQLLHGLFSIQQPCPPWILLRSFVA